MPQSGRKRNVAVRRCVGLLWTGALAWSWAGFAAAVTLAADDWPAYQRDARRSAVGPARLEWPLGLRWVHRAAEPPRPAWPEPGRTVHMLDFDYAFQPVVADGLVYFGSSADDTLYALDAADGSIRWTFTAGAPLRLAPHVAGGRCYFAGDDGMAYCLDARTGAVVWRFQAAPENRMVAGNGRMISRWPCRSGVLVLDGTVYLTAGMWPSEGVYYYALDARTGEVRWCNDTLNALYLAYPHDGQSFGGPTPQGYLLSDGEVLLVPTGESAPAALCARTGRFLYWHPQQPGSTWACLGAGFAMVAGRGWQPDQDVRLGEAPLFHGDGIAMLGLEDGRPGGPDVWRQYDRLPGSARHGNEHWRGQVGPIGGRDRTVLAGERLYASGMGVVEAIDCSGDVLRRLWQVEHPRAYCLAAAGDVLLAGCDGFVAALDGRDGQTLWRGRVEGQARALAMAGGALYVATDRGVLHAFAPGLPNDAPPPDPLRQAEEPRTGFALVVGGKDTVLAEELAAAERLNVICLLDDEAAVAAARRRLLGRGYGTRVVAHREPDDGALPYADFFANRVVLDGGPGRIDPTELHRVLHPCTGVMRLEKMSDQAAAEFVRRAGIPESELHGNVVHRGPLEGAFDWNSENDVDRRVAWPLELLWFGGPGRQRTRARHVQGDPPPVAAHGRLFAPGDGYVIAVDAYNGFELWSRHAPGYRHISADDRHAYVGLGDRVMQCDAQSGRLERVFGRVEPVVFALDEPKVFAAESKGEYGGAITVARSPTALEVTLDTRTPQPDDKDCWTLWFDFRRAEERLLPSGRGAATIIVNTKSATLRKSDGFAGAVPPRVELGRSGSSLLLRIPLDGIRELVGREPADFDLSAELALHEEFSRRLRSFPITAGRDPWRNGTATFVLDGEATEAASPLASVPRAELGDLPPHARDWGRAPLHLRHDGNIPRPPLAAEADLALGDRLHAITRLAGERFYLRAYGCSGTIASATMDFFRSGTLGMYDLADDSGMRNFPGVKPGCRITLLPALGLLLSTEGTADCFCPYNFATTLALAPAHRRRNEDWALMADRTAVAPTRQLALNFGAPGDRRDAAGTLWIGYPRQPLMFATGGSFGRWSKTFDVPMAVEWFDGGRTPRLNADRAPIHGAENPWVAASALEGVRKLTLGLIYHEPGATCLALPTADAPRLDGALDDAAWQGDPGLPAAAVPGSSTGQGRVRVRCDDEHLYLGYEQRAAVGRRGEVAPWDDAHFDVLLKDADASAYAHFKVTASGETSSRALSAVVRVPRIAGAADVTIDGRADDWGDRGLQIDLGKERGTMRLGWNDAGLLVLMRLPPPVKEETPRPGLRAQFANLQSPAVVEADIDTARRTAKALEVVLGSDKRPADGPAFAASNRADLPTEPLAFFRGAKPLAGQLAASPDEDGLVVEALIPFDRLRLDPGPDAIVGFQLVAYDPASTDQNISGGAGARRALFGSGSLLSLVLADSAEAAQPVSTAAERREWFGSAWVFSATERAIPPGSWKAAVAADEESFRAEMAVSRRVLAAAGLSPDRLLAQFRTPGTIPANLDQLYAGFRTRSVRVHTERVPPGPSRYTLRLHFAELDEIEPGRRVFDVKVQGRTVAESLDVAGQAGGPRRLLSRTFHVAADKEIVIEFVPKSGAPLVNGLELIGHDAGD